MEVTDWKEVRQQIHNTATPRDQRLPESPRSSSTGYQVKGRSQGCRNEDSREEGCPILNREPRKKAYLNNTMTTIIEIIEVKNIIEVLKNIETSKNSEIMPT